MSDVNARHGRPEVAADLATTTVKGRSLWADARGTARPQPGRGGQHRACSSLIALACLIGPLFTGHDYDQVYQDYVRAPASISSLSQAGADPPARSTASRRACAPRSRG